MAVTRFGVRRRSLGVILAGCVAVAVLAGCASSHPRTEETAVPSSQSLGPALSGTAMNSIAQRLRQTVPCDDGDALQDDLAFWDAMRGFDCFDGAEPVFIRVYAHAASVQQTLEEWADTLNAQRAVARGDNWYVIGPPAVITSLRAPQDAPKVAGDVGVPTALGAEQDYLTTCTRFVASEGERYVEHPRKRSGSAEQYEALFPGVAAAVREAVDGLGRQRVRQISDPDRRIAALSPMGPELKAKCAKAYDEVRDRVNSFEGIQ